MAKSRWLFLCILVASVALVGATTVLWFWSYLTMYNYQDEYVAGVDPPAWSAESMQADEVFAFHFLNWGAIALAVLAFAGLVVGAIGFVRTRVPRESDMAHPKLAG